MSSKINFQVKQLAKELDLKEVNETNISLLIDNLLLQTREFQRKPLGLVKKAVIDAFQSIDLKSLIQNESTNSSTNKPVQNNLVNIPRPITASLNNSLTNLYHNASTKRVGLPNDNEYIISNDEAALDNEGNDNIKDNNSKLNNESQSPSNNNLKTNKKASQQLNKKKRKRMLKLNNEEQSDVENEITDSILVSDLKKFKL